MRQDNRFRNLCQGEPDYQRPTGGMVAEILTYQDGLRRALQITEEMLDQTKPDGVRRYPHRRQAMGALRHLAVRLDRELAKAGP